MLCGNMALQAGTQLGPYEILALIGEGGMGEVYRAHDSWLKRETVLDEVQDEATVGIQYLLTNP